jgi:hypothetical protein
MIAGILGAWVVILGVLLSLASVFFLLGEWEDRRQRKRGLKGLLRILDMEIAGNERLLRIFDEHPDCFPWTPARSLQTKAWEEVKIALVLLSKKDKQFHDIASYYEDIHAVERDRKEKVESSEEEPFRGLETGPQETAQNSEGHEHQRVAKRLRFLLEMSDIARGHIRKYGCVSDNAT